MSNELNREQIDALTAINFEVEILENKLEASEKRVKEMEEGLKEIIIRASVPSGCTWGTEFEYIREIATKLTTP